MQLTLKTDFPDVQKRLDQLRQEMQQVVMARSVNKSLDQAKTQMARSISREFNVTSTWAKDRLSVRRASTKGSTLEVRAVLMGSNSSKGRSANIIRFVVGSSAKRGGKGAAPLYVRIKRTSPRKALPGAFVGNQGRTVFRRVGKERLPIEPVQTIDLAQMFNTRRIKDAIVTTIKTKFPDIFERELKYALSRFGK